MRERALPSERTGTRRFVRTRRVNGLFGVFKNYLAVPFTSVTMVVFVGLSREPERVVSL